MSSAAKAGLLIGAIAIAVVAFLVARPSDDDDGDRRAAQTTPSQPQDQASDKAEPSAPPPPVPTRIRIRDGAVVGGAPDIKVDKGETVRIVISADAADELHLHGYDITREAEADRPARFRFEADLEGAFEIESHTAEDAGKDPLVARLLVEPS